MISQVQRHTPPAGVGGLLILPLIWLVLVIVSSASAFIAGLAKARTGTTAGYDYAILGIQMVGGLIAFLLLLSQHRWAPWVMIALLAFVFVSSIVDNWPIFRIAVSGLDKLKQYATALVILSVDIVPPLLLLPYFLVSKRVANTYRAERRAQ